MRARPRRGRSGKRLRVLDLINNYWDQIEGDLLDYHVDARDWVKGLRPWSQFLTYCNKIANTDGTELRAAQLKDDRFDAEIEKMLAAAGKETSRPPLEGDTAVVRALRDLSNDIRLLIRLQTNADIPLRLGPETAVDRIEARRKSVVRTHLSHLLD